MSISLDNNCDDDSVDLLINNGHHIDDDNGLDTHIELLSKELVEQISAQVIFKKNMEEQRKEINNLRSALDDTENIIQLKDGEISILFHERENLVDQMKLNTINPPNKEDSFKEEKEVKAERNLIKKLLKKEEQLLKKTHRHSALQVYKLYKHHFLLRGWMKWKQGVLISTSINRSLRILTILKKNEQQFRTRFAFFQWKLVNQGKKKADSIHRILEKNNLKRRYMSKYFHQLYALMRQSKVLKRILFKYHRQYPIQHYFSKWYCHTNKLKIQSVHVRYKILQTNFHHWNLYHTNVRHIKFSLSRWMRVKSDSALKYAWDCWKTYNVTQKILLRQLCRFKYSAKLRLKRQIIESWKHQTITSQSRYQGIILQLRFKTQFRNLSQTFKVWKISVQTIKRIRQIKFLSTKRILKIYLSRWHSFRSDVNSNSFIPTPTSTSVTNHSISSVEATASTTSSTDTIVGTAGITSVPTEVQMQIQNNSVESVAVNLSKNVSIDTVVAIIRRKRQSKYRQISLYKYFGAWKGYKIYSKTKQLSNIFQSLLSRRTDHYFIRFIFHKWKSFTQFKSYQHQFEYRLHAYHTQFIRLLLKYFHSIQCSVAFNKWKMLSVRATNQIHIKHHLGQQKNVFLTSLFDRFQNISNDKLLSCMLLHWNKLVRVMIFRRTKIKVHIFKAWKVVTQAFNHYRVSLNITMWIVWYEKMQNRKFLRGIMKKLVNSKRIRCGLLPAWCQWRHYCQDVYYATHMRNQLYMTESKCKIQTSSLIQSLENENSLLKELTAKQSTALNSINFANQVNIESIQKQNELLSKECTQLKFHILCKSFLRCHSRHSQRQAWYRWQLCVQSFHIPPHQDSRIIITEDMDPTSRAYNIPSDENTSNSNSVDGGGDGGGGGLLLESSGTPLHETATTVAASVIDTYTSGDTSATQAIVGAQHRNSYVNLRNSVDQVNLIINVLCRWRNMDLSIAFTHWVRLSYISKASVAGIQIKHSKFGRADSISPLRSSIHIIKATRLDHSDINASDKNSSGCVMSISLPPPSDTTSSGVTSNIDINDINEKATMDIVSEDDSIPSTSTNNNCNSTNNTLHKQRVNSGKKMSVPDPSTIHSSDRHSNQHLVRPKESETQEDNFNNNYYNNSLIHRQQPYQRYNKDEYRLAADGMNTLHDSQYNGGHSEDAHMRNRKTSQEEHYASPSPLLKRETQSQSNYNQMVHETTSSNSNSYVNYNSNDLHTPPSTIERRFGGNCRDSNNGQDNNTIVLDSIDSTNVESSVRSRSLSFPSSEQSRYQHQYSSHRSTSPAVDRTFFQTSTSSIDRDDFHDTIHHNFPIFNRKSTNISGRSEAFSIPHYSHPSSSILGNSSGTTPRRRRSKRFVSRSISPSVIYKSTARRSSNETSRLFLERASNSDHLCSTPYCRLCNHIVMVASPAREQPRTTREYLRR